MPWFSSSSLCSRLRSWVRDYDRIQSLAVTFLYIQIGCALLGSLSALFNGVLLINLVVALFALVAIESSSQSLGRSYAVLLACAIMLDIFWFIFFSHTIWNVAPEKYGRFFAFSVKLALSMQIIGFSADPSLGKPRTNAALLTDKFQSSSRGHLDFGTCSITSFEPF